MSAYAGKGTQVCKASGDIYDGDWQAGMRHSFGTLSVRDETSGEYIKKYSGGWTNDRRHVSRPLHSHIGCIPVIVV